MIWQAVVVLELIFHQLLLFQRHSNRGHTLWKR